MAYQPWQIAVLQRYGLFDEAGQPVMKLLRRAGDEEPGPKVDPEVINRLFLADTTPNHKWTALDATNRSWVFFQAGGGESALNQSASALNYLKKRFVHLYSEEEWEEHESRFHQELGTAEHGSADQDICGQMRGVFGYVRKWPGRENVYEHVVVALTKFLAQYRKLVEMNKNVTESAVQPTEPSQIETWQAMEDINKKVANWLAAKRVRTDVRLAKHKQENTIYDDDYVTVIVPLTYAAAVKYGWEDWEVSDKSTFVKVAQGNLHENPWDSFVRQGGVVAMLQFNVPMPMWIRRNNDAQGGHSEYGLENLLFNLPQNMVSQNPNNWQATDEENNQITVAQIKDMIRHEAGKAQNAPLPDNISTVRVRGGGYQEVPHPVYKLKPTFPVDVKAQVVPDPQEGEEIISHLNLALDEIQRWAKKFKGKVAQVIPKD